jgi:hypothetical protein
MTFNAPYGGRPAYEEDLSGQPVYQCCVFRGAVVALSAITGQILWKTYAVPSNNEVRAFSAS